ncbi:MAG TPA: hypothetical protein VGB76_06335, partial [Pyrinomonadaceae bacterium]
MKKNTKKRNSTSTNRCRRNERGAALIMMLLISMLLLAAGGALIMTTALSTTTVYEATPEMQAYYAAETGLEDVLTVLRGNVAPQSAGMAAPAASKGSSVLASVSSFASSAYSAFMPTAHAAAPTGGNTTDEIPDAKKINMRRALDHAYADHPNDPENAPDLRLSRWLDYDYTPPNGDYPDRVTLNDNYSPLTGTAYRVTLSDADDSTSVAYTTTGLFKAGGPGVVISGNGRSITFNNILGPAVGTGTVTYVPRTDQTAFDSYPAIASNLGSFNISSTGIGASIPPGVTFELFVNQKAPWQGSASLNANLSGLVNPVAVLNSLQVGFPKDTLLVDGTTIKITNLVGGLLSLLVPPAGGSVPLQANVTAPEPKRVLVRSTGIGPRGAQKILEMLLTRANLEFEAPATLTVRGSSDCSGMTFSTGSSNAKTYTGEDLNGKEPQRPAFAVTACDYDDAVNGTTKGGTVEGPPQIGILDNGMAAGTMTTAPVQMPEFLKTPDKARQYLNELEATARAQGRYINPASGTSTTVNSGTLDNPVFTFVDGDCELTGGAGLLVVTGNVNMSGNTSFQGVVLVMGEGSVNRNGGGSGDIDGSMVISKFERTWPASEDDPSIPNNVEYPFLAPSFNTNGGGASTMQYSSTAVARA